LLTGQVEKRGKRFSGGEAHDEGHRELALWFGLRGAMEAGCAQCGENIDRARQVLVLPEEVLSLSLLLCRAQTCYGNAGRDAQYLPESHG
jgi:hypothetical protein